MSLLLIDNYVKRVGIVYLNVLEMLEARGIDREIVKRNTVDKYLSERIKKFILEKDSVFIDISINYEGKKYAVRFYDKTTIRTDGKTGLSNLWTEASMTEDLGENDELIADNDGGSDVETILDIIILIKNIIIYDDVQYYKT